MAKTRAQRKAERRKREQQAQRQGQEPRADDVEAQHRTQVPESAEVVEAEIAERTGATPEDLVKQTDVLGQELPAPAPSRADVGAPDQVAPEEIAPEEVADRRERRRLEKEQRKREKEEQRAEEERKKARAAARKTTEPTEERQRGRVISFLLSSWAELKRVQWPDRETLIQASAVTLIFISVAAAYLGVLDAAFNWLIKQIL